MVNKKAILFFPIITCLLFSLSLLTPISIITAEEGTWEIGKMYEYSTRSEE
ncbi:MAG: hypothetical protein U9O98_07855 [Asgard group archaeon]|nr:hypothetical protein [Asgard group archaeon]